MMLLYYLLIIWSVQTTEPASQTIYLPIVKSPPIILEQQEEKECGWIYPPLDNPPICEFW